MDETLKAKGRAISALRCGLRQARSEFLETGNTAAAEDAQRALDRADRMEREGALPPQMPVAA